MGILSAIQVQRWSDTRTLFDYTLSVRPDSLVAHRVLADELSQSNPAAAANHFREALAIRSDDPTTHYNYATLLERHGSLDDAMVQLRATLVLNPHHFKALDDMGVAMERLRQSDDAQGYFQQSIVAAAKSHAEFATAHLHLGMLLAGEGDDAAAMASFRPR